MADNSFRFYYPFGVVSKTYLPVKRIEPAGRPRPVYVIELFVLTNYIK